jgi:hypothetical protein
MASGGTHTQGAFCKLLIEPGAAPHTFDANSYATEFLTENIAKKGRHGGNNGIRGTLARQIFRRRQLAAYFHGSVNMYVSPSDFAFLLLNVMGYTESPAGTFVPSTAASPELPYFGIQVFREARTFEIKNCKLNSWTLRSRAPDFGDEGEPDMCYLTLDVIGSEENNNATFPGTPPAIGTTALADTPYTFQDGVYTLSAAARAVEEFTLKETYNVKAKYANELFPHSLRATDRIVQARFKVPYNATNLDLYGQAVTGAAGSIVLTNSTVSTSITFGKLSVYDQSPTASQGKQQVALEVEGHVLADGATPELTIVNDKTP